jgi:hypothetical protein
MKWGALGSIGLIAFMGCTGPVVAQQTQPRPSWPQAISLLLLRTGRDRKLEGLAAGALGRHKVSSNLAPTYVLARDWDR